MFEILSFISESSTSSEQAEKEPRHPTIDVCQATNFIQTSDGLEPPPPGKEPGMLPITP